MAVQRARRFKLLQTIATAQVQAGLDPFETLHAVLTADGEPDAPRARGLALLNMGILISRANGDASQIFLSAVATALRIRGLLSRTEVLSKIAVAQADARFFADALATAAAIHPVKNRIEDQRADLPGDALPRSEKVHCELESYRVLIEIAAALAANSQLAKALNTARQIEHEEYFTEALCRVAGAAAKVGLEVGPVFAEALASTDHIYDRSQRVWALVAIAKTLARSGWFADARHTAKAIAAHRWEFPLVGVLCEIGMAQANAGLKARSLFVHAMKAAVKIEDAELRDGNLVEVAVGAARAGLFPDALATASKIRSSFRRATALHEIASLTIIAGFDPSPILADAFRTATGIDDPVDSAKLFCAHAALLAKLGQDPRPLLLRAKIAARKFEKTDSEEFVGIMVEVAEVERQAKIDDTGTLKEAMTMAKGNINLYWRDGAIVSVTTAAARIGLFDFALTAYDLLLRGDSSLRQALDHLNVISSEITWRYSCRSDKLGLIAFLKRAAGSVEGACHSCTVLAKLYPDSVLSIASLLER